MQFSFKFTLNLYSCKSMFLTSTMKHMEYWRSAVDKVTTWTFLKFKFLSTGKLNQDPLENTFGAICMHCGSKNIPSDSLKTVISNGNGNNTSSMLMQTPQARLLRAGTGTRKSASAAIMCYKTDQIQVIQGYTNTWHNVSHATKFCMFVSHIYSTIISQ